MAILVRVARKEEAECGDERDELEGWRRERERAECGHEAEARGERRRHRQLRRHQPEDLPEEAALDVSGAFGDGGAKVGGRIGGLGGLAGGERDGRLGIVLRVVHVTSGRGARGESEGVGAGPKNGQYGARLESSCVILI